MMFSVTLVYLHCPFKLDKTLLITLTYKQKQATKFHAIRFDLSLLRARLYFFAIIYNHGCFGCFCAILCLVFYSLSLFLGRSVNSVCFYLMTEYTF